MDQLRIAWQVGETLLASVPFEDDPDGTRYNILLAIQEMLTNVLRHGYAGAEEEPLVLRMEACDEGFSVELRDRATAFNPLEYEIPDLSQEVEECPDTPGGYGIVIVRMVMDEIDYVREDGWNVLRMTKSAMAAVASDN